MSFSIATHGMNQLWAWAYNYRKDTKLTHWVMIHSDVSPKGDWLNTILDEQDRLDCDVLSVVMPIKDDFGLTSTGVRYPGNWDVRRLSMTEVCRLPETFNGADLNEPGKEFVFNTGLIVVRFNEKVWRDFPGFRVDNRMVYDEAADTIQPYCWPEDWEFSLWAQKQGLKCYVTRKVKAIHHGGRDFRNDEPWGLWTTDQCYKEFANGEGGLKFPDEPVSFQDVSDHRTGGVDRRVVHSS